MANFNQSLQEAVCIDNEVFFGPVTEKERKIREQFERFGRSDKEAVGEPFKSGENEISRNDSLYKSFSIDDSKYDSFDDSLNEEIDEKPQETRHVTVRRTYDRLKSKRHAFYDSLEDICSLVSHVDKCSISCENGNDNVIEKQKIIEDSLKSQPVIVANKIHGFNEQINYDEDSLAILELENTFDDSLEDCNLLSSIEIEEASDVDNIVAESPNHADQKPICISRNLFDTSVEVVYEKKSMTGSVEKDLHDSKNVMFDSLSSSDFKDILKDSLEESENFNPQLNFNVASKISNINDTNQNHPCVPANLDTSVQIISEKKNGVVYRVKKDYCDDKNRLSDSLSSSDYKDIMKDSLEESENCNGILHFRAPENSTSVINQGVVCNSGNLFDTSVQIICEKNNMIGPEDKQISDDDKNILLDSLSNSVHEDFCKDRVDETKDKTKVRLISDNVSASNAQELEQIPSTRKDILDTSVQVICEKINNLSQEEIISVSKCNIALKDNLENFDNVDEFAVEEVVHKTTDKNETEKTVYSSNVDKDIFYEITENNYSENSDKHFFHVVSDSHQKCLKGKDSSVIVDQMAQVSSASNADLKKEVVDQITQVSSVNSDDFKKKIVYQTDQVPSASNVDLKKEIITIDSCQLKILNDNLNIDKDVKFQLHIEVTVGDKKCQIAAEDIKLLVKDLNSEKCDNSISPKVTIVHNDDKTEKNTHIITEEHVSKTKSNVQEIVISEKKISSEKNKKDSGGRSEDTSEITIPQRDLVKAIDKAEEQIITHKIDDTSLLQALDLHNISVCFINESIIQSKDSIMPLNLCSRDRVQKVHTSAFKNESKENLPESCLSSPQYSSKKIFNSKSNKISPNKLNHDNKTPKKLKNSPSFKEMSKKTGTKIPVRKIDNFMVPTPSTYKVKHTSPVVSAEKVKKYPQTQLCTDGEKKTPGATPHKHHFCKVRNTIFSKVPQITPSKKYVNIQSPVAKYIKNAQGCGTVKTPVLDPPVLHDCMNKLHIHQQYESPHHGYEFHSPKDSTLKQTKRKA